MGSAWAFPFRKTSRKAEQRDGVESVVAPAAAAETNSFYRSPNFRQKADEAYPEPQAGHAHIGRNYTLRWTSLD